VITENSVRILVARWSQISSMNWRPCRQSHSTWKIGSLRVAQSTSTSKCRESVSDKERKPRPNLIKLLATFLCRAPGAVRLL